MTLLQLGVQQCPASAWAIVAFRQPRWRVRTREYNADDTCSAPRARAGKGANLQAHGAAAHVPGNYLLRHGVAAGASCRSLKAVLLRARGGTARRDAARVRRQAMDAFFWNWRKDVGSATDGWNAANARRLGENRQHAQPCHFLVKHCAFRYPAAVTHTSSMAFRFCRAGRGSRSSRGQVCVKRLYSLDRRWTAATFRIRKGGWAVKNGWAAAVHYPLPAFVQYVHAGHVGQTKQHARPTGLLNASGAEPLVLGVFANAWTQSAMTSVAKFSGAFPDVQYHMTSI